MRYALLALLLASPALANGTNAETETPNIYGEPQTQTEGTPRECDVCTARHKSLQRLQEKRLSLPDPEEEPGDDS
ncbi:hypothetical protein [Roseovarius sp.]|uniref:hypothetical protein n=1 Tax=Roseovarius sp. TaxID=1486281 RepID=UPI003BAD11B0